MPSIKNLPMKWFLGLDRDKSKFEISLRQFIADHPVNLRLQEILEDDIKDLIVLLSKEPRSVEELNHTIGQINAYRKVISLIKGEI